MLAEYERLFLEAKELYGASVVLLLQVGSFWEIYYTDTSAGHETASLARDVLGLALMKKDCDYCSAGFNFPGDDKIAKLLDAGFTVCLGEQVPKSEKEKGKVDRVLGRCFSPGMRQDTSGNYACSLFTGTNGFGVAMIDVSTGCSVVMQSHCVAGITALIQSRNVTAVIVNGAGTEQFWGMWSSKAPIQDNRPSNKLNDATCECLLGDAFGRCGFTMDDELLLTSRPLAKYALGHLLSWAKGLASAFGKLLPKPLVIDPDSVLSFSKSAASQLGVHELEKLLNCAATPPGRRQFKHSLFNPCVDVADISRRHDMVELCMSEDVDAARAMLSKTGDLQRWCRKTRLQEIAVAEAAHVTGAVRAALDVATLCGYYPGCEEAAAAAAAWLDALAALDTGDPCLFPGSVGVTEAHARVEAAREALQAIARTVHPDARLEAVSNGHRIRISVKRLESVPDVKARFAVSRCAAGALLTSAALDAASAAEKEAAKELEDVQEAAWRDILAEVPNDAAQQLADWVCEVDVAHACAYNALRYGHVRPTLVAGEEAEMRATLLGNPVAESAMERYSKDLYVRNDVALDRAERHILLFAANGGGKSCLLRSVGLVIAMAQAGMFVAAESMTLSPFKRVDTRILTPDDVHRGLSSYTAELAEIREAMNSAGTRSLLLADELYASTEAESGTALAGTTVAWLAQLGTKVFATTHFLGIVDHPAIKRLPGLRIMNMAMTTLPGIGMVYERKLSPGPCNPGYGLIVAGAFGFDAAFIRDATAARAELTGEKVRKSRYSSKVQVSKCEGCGARATETHHIKPRCDAVDGKHGYASENHPSNLIALCETCHLRAHAEGLTRVKTLQGYKTLFGAEVV